MSSLDKTHCRNSKSQKCATIFLQGRKCQSNSAPIEELARQNSVGDYYCCEIEIEVKYTYNGQCGVPLASHVATEVNVFSSWAKWIVRVVSSLPYAFLQRVFNRYTVGSWPWMASIGSYENGNWVHKCGGSIVSSIHILTAAHCVNAGMG